ncbi:hypothetical protein CYY_003018 [Polysphondylium violaceum]|uniref:Tetratricopeptide-like helical domain-containing protein n=1 Tax=Polysphondylium violaceum TaxID=133409 RepID=A0A8J4V943_9MYCE|nr:hypothetical protein CYY_003018 [Polysphondylium violaceum]
MEETIKQFSNLDTKQEEKEEKEITTETDNSKENNDQENDNDDIDRSKDKEKLKEVTLKDKYKTNQDDLTESNNLKTFGNRAYTDKDYTLAIKYYNEAISLLKKEDIGDTAADGGDDTDTTKTATKKIIEIREIDEEKDILNCSEELAVLYSNRSACYLITGKHELVLADCTTALQYEPTPANIRVKIYHRRAQSREALEKHREALEDYQEILKLDAKFSQAHQAVKRLQPIVKAKEEQEREEMMGKLKDLGNMVLGKFGLSTDNFQFVKDPSSGGYSVNFKR